VLLVRWSARDPSRPDRARAACPPAALVWQESSPPWTPTKSLPRAQEQELALVPHRTRRRLPPWSWQPWWPAASSGSGIRQTRVSVWRAAAQSPSASWLAGTRGGRPELGGGAQGRLRAGPIWA